MEEALFDKMNVKELRIQLELKGLDTKGLKADLLKRLKEYCSNSRKKRLSYQLNDESDEEECPDDCLCGIQKMDVEEIKSQLRTDGVSINGSKDELVQRLLNHLKKKFQNEEDDDDDDEEMESASDTEQIEINIYKKNSEKKTDTEDIGRKKRGNKIIYNYVEKFKTENEALEVIANKNIWIKSK
jgi:hypothetical protein